MVEVFPAWQQILDAGFLGMSVKVWLVLTIVLVAAVAFFREWAGADVIALCAMAATFLCGLLTTGEMLEVFSNRAPLTIAAMFVVSAGLEATGAIDAMGRVFQRIAGKSELRVMFTLMFIAAVLSAFINNTPVVVVFLPIVKGLARTLNLNTSRLLIPLSFASILGGTCTLTGTSTNLIIDDLAQSHGLEPFGMFELTKIGVFYTIVGFVYLGTLGRRLLPDRKTLEEMVEPPEDRQFLTQFSVEKDSPLVGRTLLDTLLKEIPEAQVLEVRRRGEVLQTPLDELEILPNDRLLITLEGASFEDLKETGVRFAAYRNLNLREMETRELRLMEGIVGPNSSLLGKTLRQAKFRQRFGVNILAVHRKGQDLGQRRDFGDMRLEFGDTLLIEGPVEAINRLQRSDDFVSLAESAQETSAPTWKLWLSIGLTLAFVAGATAQPLAIPAFAILAGLAMIVTGCLDSKEAYRSVQWNIIFLIFGMLAVGKALEVTGTAGMLAHGIVRVFGAASPVIILSVVYLLSSILTELISNNAVAALLTPIVISMAVTLEVDPRPFIVALMLGCSASFATPIGYQTNTYVYGAGGYRFSDFLRAGILLNLILWLLATLLIPVFWPF